MTVPSVQTTNQNLQQGIPDGVENRFLVIGTGTINKGNLQMVSGTTDLAVALGDGALKKNVQALVDNALVGGDVYGAVYVLNDAETFEDGLAAAKAAGFNAELLILADQFSVSGDIEAVQTKLISLKLNGDFMAGIIAVPGIDAETQTWAQYATANTALLGAINADHLCIVPQLTDTCIGVFSGRICRGDLSVGDTPVRTKSGPVLSLGNLPIDVDGVAYDTEHAIALDAVRLSVPVSHRGQPGVYWGDAVLLDGPTGDYKSLEVLRVILKGSRRVHARMFSRLGDRTLNRSVTSTKAGETYAAGPLNDMARDRPNNEPGEIYKPAEDDVKIFWVTDEHFELSVAMQPVKSAKKIVNKIHVKQAEVEA